MKIWFYTLYNYKHLTTAPSHLRSTQLRTLLLHPNLFKSSLFTLSQEAPISLKSFLMTSSHPRRGRAAFLLAPDGWPKRKIFGNLSPFVHRMCPTHLSLSFIIVLESRIEPHFLCFHTLLLKKLGWKHLSI